MSRHSIQIDSTSQEFAVITDQISAQGGADAPVLSIPIKFEFAKLKEFVKSKSEFDWANKVLEATEEWLDKIIKATSSFSSKTHHTPSVGHFSRTEAEIVLMITTGIIAYIGKIEYKSE